MKSCFAPLLPAVLALALSAPAQARSAAEYLPGDADLDPAVPTPESVLGWEVGDWHVSHDKLLAYVTALAEQSPRVSIREIGRSYEERPLVLMTITAEQNFEQLESMRQAHLDGDPGAPLVVWLGYSVHGDEPSGSNASMLAAYYLAASRSEFVQDLLVDTVVILDPSLNPDGLNRFASWANSNAGAVPVADPATRQHHEPWPTGRTNHYWFDLNRDWLPLVHPESRARMAEFQRWRPHVLTDHHEQGGYPGFFFQPGVPTRQNPLTPAENLELTRALANFHAQAMDRAGQPVFTEEAFDDFYYGKGSTYPDINGGIGILFEQKAIAGQALETSNGVETFSNAVANHLRMSLSTLRGSWELRERLHEYQRGFFRDTADAAQRADHAGWIVGDDGDPARARVFLDLLDQHDIAYLAVDENVQHEGRTFNAGQSWFLPARQRQFGLLRAMMEQRTSFEDETFYDVSAWTLPLANNLPFAALSRSPDTSEPVQSSNGLVPDENAAAWLIPWNQLNAAAVLQQLLDTNARVRTAIKPFSAQTGQGLTALTPGTLLVQAGIQDEDTLPEIRRLLAEVALSGTTVHSAGQTMTPVGPDFGSANFARVEAVKPLLMGGGTISSYGAGEAWFTLDQRVGLATTIVEFDRMADLSLGRYTHLILPDGDYSLLDPARLNTLTGWVLGGGIVVAFGRAAPWVEAMCFEPTPELCPLPEATAEEAEAEAPDPRPYGSLDEDIARRTIGGAIVATRLDATHPLAFGFPRDTLPIMRVGATVLKPSQNAYSTPVRYTDDPLMAGYIGEERLAEFAGGPAVIAEKRGQGLVVRFADNPLFRGFWRGSERLFLNALFFGQVIEATELPE